MVEISKLSQEQLIQKSTLDEISKQVKDCIGYNTKADELASELEKRLAETNLEAAAPKIYKVYKYFILLLKFEALDLYTDQEVLDLIEKYCLESLILGPNFLRQLRVKLLVMAIGVRDTYLRDLRNVLKRNEQEIGKEPISITREAKPQSPQVKNWIADYDDLLGIEHHVDVERSTYFTRSTNVRTLSEREKEILRRLLCFYDLLKLPISEIGGLGSFSAGLVEEKEIPLPVFKSLMSPLDLLKEEVPKTPPKPAVVPPVAPPKPPVEIEKEIEAKRKAEEERIARLEREMRPKVAPPPVEVPRPKPFAPPPKPEVAPSPKIKPAPSFPTRPAKPARPAKIEAGKPPRIEAALPPPPKPTLPPKPRVPVKITSIDDIKKLTASDFRGYAEVPKDSARAIVEKINSILVSPLDRIKALSFWKESDLYKLYIEMGRESMAQEKSVKEVADERKAQGKLYLTHEEFEAIVEISGAIG